MKDFENLQNYLELLDRFGSKEELLKYLNDKEEEYISTEILPFLENRLKTFKRAFNLEISYVPGQDIKVKMNRGSQISAVQAEEKPISSQKKKRKVPGKYKDLKITTSDGTVIQEGAAKATYIKALQTVGIDRLLKYDRNICGMPFIYKGYNPNYKDYEQPFVLGEYRTNVCFGHERKKEYLEDLFMEVGLNWKVQLIEK